MAAITTARELWDRLVEEGGLQPSGWDDDLLEDVRLRLQLPPDVSFPDVLTATAPPVEELVLAILALLRPFGAMLSDLFALFARYGVRHSGAFVAIEFDFGHQGKEDLRFDLKEFQDGQRALQRAISTVRRWDWDAETHWDLLRILRQSLSSVSEPGVSDRAARAWLDEWKKELWPDRVLAPPETSNQRLTNRLAEIWELWRAVVEESRAAVADGSWRWLQRTEDPAPEEERLVLLEMLENDHFSAGLVRAAYTAVEQMERPGSSDAADDLTIALTELIKRHPPTLAKVDVAVDTLRDVLNLPVFKHRYDLYGAWVFTQLVAAWSPGTHLRVDGGVLRFPFKATVLADLLDTHPPVAVVCELRTPLKNPKGKSRKAAIQPDYSVLVGELPDDLQDRVVADLAVMDIECKQYKSPANKDFAYALEDYARGRPKSYVVLVSHGRLNSKTITDKVAKEVRNRTEAIANLHPLELNARERLAELVNRQVGPYRVASQVPPASPMRVTLTWDRAPIDLDLHLFIEPGGAHVHHSELGDLSVEPFAKLYEDVRSVPGEEIIEVTQWLERHYVIAVNAYSDDAPLAGSDARVSIDLGGTVHEWPCPSSGTGHWWHVCTFDPTSGTFDVFNTIHAE
jgi:hypothetical protein